MRFYTRSRDDKLNAIRRTLAEAERGHVHLALDRVQDLADEFPDDPEILYVEGLLRQDHLGQGMKARELFERVYHLIPPNAPRLGETRAFAACNAASLSRDGTEALRWLEWAIEAGPDDSALAQFADGVRAALRQGVAYGDILSNGAAECQAHGAHGKMAGLLELALAITPPMELTKEADARRQRAQALREVDRKAMTQRRASHDIPMPDERMALREALSELERALELDPYDAEAWNFRSAWCILLQRYEEAIPHAEQALEIRPHGYTKPLINKATALGFLGRHAEAEPVAQAAVDGAEDAADQGLARSVLENCRTPPSPLSPRSVRDLSRVVMDEARNTAGQELGAQGGGPARLADGIAKRFGREGGADPAGDARVLAELLGDFFPETVFVALSLADRTHWGLLSRLVDAGRYLVTHATGVVRRDAARFLILTVLSGGNAAAIHREYNRLCLGQAGPSDAGDSALRRVLHSFDQRLIAFLTGPEPAEDTESKSGCVAGSAVLVLAAVIVAILLFP